VVKHVEGLGPKLNLDLLGRFEVFVDGHVEIGAVRIIQAISS
jgi:hypothetical protein